MIQDFISTPNLGAVAVARPSGTYLVGKLDDHTCTPAAIDACIEDGRIQHEKGMFACPLTVNNVRGAARLGQVLDLRVLDMHGYEYPGPYDAPMDHQRATASFLAVHPRAFCLNEMGTGKTASVLWAIDFGLRRKVLKRVLIVCPKQCIHDVWGQHVKDIFPLGDYAAMTGARDRRIKQLERGLPITIINHDALRTYTKDLKKVKWDLIVIDECTQFKNPESARSKKMFELASDTPRLWQLSGSIMPEGPLDVWHPAKMCNPFTVPTFHKFKERVTHTIRIEPQPGGKRFRPFTKDLPKRGSTERAYRLLQPAVRFPKSECVDLPPLTEQDIHCPMSKEQQRAFTDLQNEVSTLIGQRRVTPDEIQAFATKALQICAGSLYVGSGKSQERLRLGAPEKIATLHRLIDESLSKTLVFTAFQDTADYLMSELKKYKPVRLDGTVSDAQRIKNTEQFKTDDECRVYIMHPRSAGHGLNLQNASTAIYVSPTHVAEDYTQSRERMARPGQQNKMTLAHLYASPEELAVYKGTARKLGQQDVLLSFFNTALTKKGTNK